MQKALFGTALLLASAPSLAAQSWTASQSAQPARTFGAAASGGGVALFAGGGHPFVGYHDEVNIYDSSLGGPSDPATWSVATLSEARANLAAASVGGVVLFAGGNGQGFGQPASSVVDIYDVATGTWSQSALSQPRWSDASTTVGGYALFAGGFPDIYGDVPCGSASPTVDAYHAATGTWSQGTLSVPRVVVQATSVGPYAFFAGGQLCSFGPGSDVVEVYDSSVGPPSDPAAWSIANLSQARALGATVSAGGKAFFAGGLAETSPGTWEAVATVDVYDSCVGPPSDADAWSVEYLSIPRSLLTATSQGAQALFAGGEDANYAYHDVVDVFDTETGTWSVEFLSAPRLATSTTVGKYALFAGGYDEDWVWAPFDLVDARQVTSGSWYVDAAAAGPGTGSPGDPFPTIQAGIDAALPGDSVRVGPGEYFEQLVVTKDLTMVSSCGRDATVLRGAGLPSGSLITTTSASFVLEGFTIANGQAPEGGGLFVSGGDVRIEDCFFLLCRAGTSMSTGEGGAIYVASGTLEVHSTLFRSNTAAGVGKGGAIYGSPLVRSCEFRDNRAEGTPVQGARGTAIFGNPRIENSIFDRNGTNASCLFALDFDSPIDVVSSTFVNNGAYVIPSSSTVRNSVFWGYPSGGGLGGAGGSADVQYCIVQGGHPGVGNLDQDPLLRAPLTDTAGLQLSWGSPAIDAGDNDAVPSEVTKDFAGRARFRDDPMTPDTGVGSGPKVDIGAFEFQPRSIWKVGTPSQIDEP